MFKIGVAGFIDHRLRTRRIFLLCMLVLPHSCLSLRCYALGIRTTSLFILEAIRRKIVSYCLFSATTFGLSRGDRIGHVCNACFANCSLSR